MSNKKYNRITEIKITINTDQKEVIVKSTGNGHIIIEDKNGKEIRPEKPRITRKYSRPHATKPEKIISQATSDNCVTTMDALLLEFDAVYAVDTNTKKCGDEWKSVGILVKGDFRKKTDKSYEIMFRHYLSITSSEKSKRPMEKWIWCKALEIIDDQETNAKKIVLVVDHDMNSIPNYNERKTPICKNYYLPERVTLIYATSDKVDNWANKAIRLCDKISSKVLKTQT